jgi:hypothetical protein
MPAMNTDTHAGTPCFVLAQSCSVSKAWHDLPGHYQSPQHAEDAATERGIYRVVCVCNGQRIGMEPFAKVGGDD